MSLDLALELIAAGVPVVVCTPNLNWKPGDKPLDVLPPKGWSVITAAECDVSGFRPGVDTLAAVGGHGLDVVDCDTKAPGFGSLDNLPPFRRFGRTGTPSGGTHDYVRSTGFAKISPFTTSAGHVGDYVGGTPAGGGRLLAFLPGSTRPKYHGKTYTVIEPLRLEELLESDPDDDLMNVLQSCGGSRANLPGRPAAGLAKVRAFLAEHSTEPERRCHFGQRAVAGLIEDAGATVSGDPKAGRHGWAVASATRCVELVRAGCAWSADLDQLEATLDRIKPEGGTDWTGVLAWAIANADGPVACGMHRPFGLVPSGNTTGAEMDDPIPFTGRRPSKPFPVASLPSPIAAMVAALAEATQTDEAMAGTSALSVMAAAAGGRAEIQARIGWREPLCLQMATIARPGERKSAVQAAMVTPLLDAEQTLAQAGASVRIEAETTRQVAEKASEQARAVAGKATPEKRGKLLAEAVSAAMFLETCEVPTIPRLVADDITPEAAGSLLAEQGGRLAIISAEGGIFDIIAGRYSSNVPNMDVFLKGHAGDPLKVDRRGRPPEYVRRPALTVGVMIQPSVLTSIGQHSSFRGRGLLARFLYSNPTSKVGRRKAGAAPVPQDVSAAYHQAITTMVEGLAGWGSDPAILTLTEQAASVVVGIETSIEPQLAEDGALGTLADWGSKYVGAVLRIAALLHLADLGPDKAIRQPIPAATLARALELGEYYKEQAVAVFGEMQTDEATADAAYLLGRLGKHDESTISIRDMHRLAQRFKTRADLEAPVKRLVENGWLTPLEADDAPAGRPKGPVFTIHAKVREQLTQLTQLTQVVA